MAADDAGGGGAVQPEINIASPMAADLMARSPSGRIEPYTRGDEYDISQRFGMLPVRVLKSTRCDRNSRAIDSTLGTGFHERRNVLLVAHL
jgi:hypothetical protein